MRYRRPGDRLQGPHRFESHLLFKWLGHAIRHPKTLAVIEGLIGPDIFCWTAHWFIKAAHSPQCVSWHQDSNYWGVETNDLVSVWPALWTRRQLTVSCAQMKHNQPSTTEAPDRKLR